MNSGDHAVRKGRQMQNGNINDVSAVKTHYATSKGLDIRLTFHDKYSTNRQGINNWLVSNYAIREGMKVLELGCGTGSMWTGQGDVIARCGKLVLTDLSDGMLDKAKENLGAYANVEYAEADIMNIPFEDDSFDIVIANFMLYHVPDIGKGLCEVRRVLKSGGRFYCATFGENNFTERLASWFRPEGEVYDPGFVFTMQNGGGKLKSVFTDVTPLFYEDSLHVTDVDDLVEYIRSLASIQPVMDLPPQQIRDVLDSHTVDGVIDIPKEYGMFICV